MDSYSFNVEGKSVCLPLIYCLFCLCEELCIETWEEIETVGMLSIAKCNFESLQWSEGKFCL